MQRCRRCVAGTRTFYLVLLRSHNTCCSLLRNPTLLPSHQAPLNLSSHSCHCFLNQGLLRSSLTTAVPPVAPPNAAMQAQLDKVVTNAKATTVCYEELVSPRQQAPFLTGPQLLRLSSLLYAMASLPYAIPSPPSTTAHCSEVLHVKYFPTALQPRSTALQPPSTDL